MVRKAMKVGSWYTDAVADANKELSDRLAMIAMIIIFITSFFLPKFSMSWLRLVFHSCIKDQVIRSVEE